MLVYLLVVVLVAGRAIPEDNQIVNIGDGVDLGRSVGKGLDGKDSADAHDEIHGLFGAAGTRVTAGTAEEAVDRVGGKAVGGGLSGNVGKGLFGIDGIARDSVGKAEEAVDRVGGADQDGFIGKNAEDGFVGSGEGLDGKDGADALEEIRGNAGLSGTDETARVSAGKAEEAVARVGGGKAVEGGRLIESDGKSAHGANISNARNSWITSPNVSAFTGKRKMPVVDEMEEIIEEDDMLFTRSKWEEIERQRALYKQKNFLNDHPHVVKYARSREWNSDLQRFVEYEQVDNLVKWPGNVLYWFFQDEQSYGSDAALARQQIQELADRLERESCFRIREDTTRSQPSAVKIIKPKELKCSSHIGAVINDHQDLILHPNCIKQKSVAHEFYHAIGFQHMHARPGREDYVVIHEENIKEHAKHNFNITEGYGFDIAGTRYDYGSVMHYGAHAFSKNDEMTMSSYGSSQYDRTMGLKEVTYLDVLSVNMLYCRDQVVENTCGSGYEFKDRCICPSGFDDGDDGDYCEIKNQWRFTASSEPGQISLKPFSKGMTYFVIMMPEDGATHVEIDVEQLQNFNCSNICINNYVEVKQKYEEATGARVCCPGYHAFYSSQLDTLILVNQDAPFQTGVITYRAKYRSK